MLQAENGFVSGKHLRKEYIATPAGITYKVVNASTQEHEQTCDCQ